MNKMTLSYFFLPVVIVMNSLSFSFLHTLSLISFSLNIIYFQDAEKEELVKVRLQNKIQQRFMAQKKNTLRECALHCFV